MERQVISECLTVWFADSHMQVKCSNYKWVVCHNTLPLQLVVGVKGLLTVHTYSDCQQLPHSTGGSLKFKVERCCRISQALEQSECENRWSHRVGLLGLVMFNGIIHLTCVWSILDPIESQRSCNWTKMYNLHQNCILCDTYYTHAAFGHFKHIVYTYTHVTSCGMDGSHFHSSLLCILNSLAIWILD